MSKQNIFDQILEEAEKSDLKTLMDDTLNETDPEKKKVLHALYTYVLDKRQEKIINRKDFIR